MKWFESHWKPDVWATLEIGTCVDKNKQEDEAQALVRGWLSGLGKPTGQHLFDYTRWGVQFASFEENKLHFHLAIRFEHSAIPTEVMEAYWMYKVKLAYANGVPSKNLKYIRTTITDYLKSGDKILLERIKLINKNIDKRYKDENNPKAQKGNFYAKIVPWVNGGTMLPYMSEDWKHGTWASLIGCPGRYGQRSCRKGRCKHRL